MIYRVQWCKNFSNWSSFAIYFDVYKFEKKEKESFLFFSKLVRVKINSKRTPIWKICIPFDSINHELFLEIFSKFSIFFFKFEIWLGAVWGETVGNRPKPIGNRP